MLWIMKPIDKAGIAQSINFIQSLTAEEKIEYCENIRELQPYAFLSVVALLQEDVSVSNVDHGMNLLMVIHHAFYSHCRSLPLITVDMLRDALDGNAAMMQSIGRGWLSHDRSVAIYPEKIMLTVIICYIKVNNLGSPCKENERLITRIKMVLDAYGKAKHVAANSIWLH